MWGIKERPDRGSSYPGHCRLNGTRSGPSDRFGTAPQRRLRPCTRGALTLVAGLGHWLIGSVDWYIVGALLLGSLPGISIGSYLAIRRNRRSRQEWHLASLASMLVLIGLRLV